VIPFNRPSIEGAELEHVRDAVLGGHISSGGPFTDRVRRLLQSALGAADVVLTSSCTDALEMSAMLLDLGPDDVVIAPSFAFVSTALAFARTGARIRFVDIEPLTLGIDPGAVAAALDDRVRAVVTVHYAGVGCDLAGLADVMRDSQAVLVEDNAHGLFGTYRGRPLGSFGRFGALSFHETKNFICGEGGALGINDPTDIARAHALLDKGTNRRSFLEGTVDHYTWVDSGSSFGMSDLLAAFLLAQLEAKEAILAKRRRIFERYMAMLSPFEEEFGFRCMRVPEDREPAYHMFYVLLPSRGVRDLVLASLKDAGVNAVFHYVPLHSAPAAVRFSDGCADCPITDEVSARLLRLPFYNALTATEIAYVVERFLEAVEAAIEVANA
jgi:dTDP-4-amino-4,6-dideoxygalactose transaminase